MPTQGMEQRDSRNIPEKIVFVLSQIFFFLSTFSLVTSILSILSLPFSDPKGFDALLDIKSSLIVFLLLTQNIGFIIMSYGLKRMRRWGVYLLTIFTVIGYVPILLNRFGSEIEWVSSLFSLVDIASLPIAMFGFFSVLGSFGSVSLVIVALGLLPFATLYCWSNIRKFS